MKIKKPKLNIGSYRFIYVIIAIAVIAIISRFVLLGARPIHHDEGMLAYFAWKLARFGEYTYTPQIHAPILFYVQALLFLIFGESSVALRTGPAVFGVALVLIPVFYAKQLGKANAICISLIFLTSPLFLYYSRFLVHTSMVIVFWLLTLISLWQFTKTFQPTKLYLVAVFLALSFCVSETTYIFVAAAIIAGLIVLFVDTQRAKAFLSRAKKFFKQNYLEVLSAFLLFVLIWILIYGVGLSNPKSLLTSLPNPFDSETSLGFWLSQHPKRLGDQKWHYYINLMVLYEPIVIVGFLGALRGVFRQKSVFYQFLIFLSVIVFAGFSYAGEKFPWLFLCPLVLCALLAGIYFAQNFKKFRWWWKLLLGLLFLFSCFNSIRLNYVNPADTAEMAVYVQTPNLVIEKLPPIIDECEKNKIKDCVAIEQKITWPLSWMFRNSSYLFVGSDANIKPTTKYIFVSSESIDGFSRPRDWTIQKYYLRDWWLAETCDRTHCIDDQLKYFLFRHIWSPKSGYDVYQFSLN
jgi:uncharacterized protein (TIGR03663 family)